MGAPKPKRTKKHRPKDVVANPLNFFFGGLKRPDSEHLTVLRIKNHKAMVALTQGAGTLDDWDLLVGMMNMAIVLAEKVVGNEYRAELLSGRDALAAVRHRYAQHERFVFTGPELRAVNVAMDVHDAQLGAARVIDVERAADEVIRRVRHRVGTANAIDLLAQAT